MTFKVGRQKVPVLGFQTQALHVEVWKPFHWNTIKPFFHLNANWLIQFSYSLKKVLNISAKIKLY